MPKDQIVIMWGLLIAGWIGWTVLDCGLHAHGVSFLHAILEERNGEGLGC